jgi:hypothetical protein
MEIFDFKRHKAVAIASIADYHRSVQSLSNVNKILIRNLSSDTDIEVDGIVLEEKEYTCIGMDNPGCRVDIDTIDIKIYAAGTKTETTAGIDFTISISTVNNLRNEILPCATK